MACGHSYWACWQPVTHYWKGFEGWPFLSFPPSLPPCRYGNPTRAMMSFSTEPVRFFSSQKRRQRRGKTHEPLFTNWKASTPAAGRKSAIASRTSPTPFCVVFRNRTSVLLSRTVQQEKKKSDPSLPWPNGTPVTKRNVVRDKHKVQSPPPASRRERRHRHWGFATCSAATLRRETSSVKVRSSPALAGASIRRGCLHKQDSP